MDSLTQIVLGAAVGEVCLGKKAGNKAALWGAVAGTIPDLDVLLKFFTDDLSANEMHRGFSHSIVFCLIAAPLLGWFIYQIHRNKVDASKKDWIKLSFWSFITHPLLDAHTTWGTQLFWPFDLRIAYKNISVVDPAYTLPFLLLLLIALFFNRKRKIRRKLVWAGIIVSSSYMLFTVAVKLHVNKIIASGIESKEIKALRYTSQPTIFNNFLWYCIVETEDSYLLTYYSILDHDKNLSFTRYNKDLELRKQFSSHEKVNRLAVLSDHWYIIRMKDNAIHFTDMRFGQMTFAFDEGSFVFNYLITNVQDKTVVIQEGNRAADFPGYLDALIKRANGI